MCGKVSIPPLMINMSDLMKDGLDGDKLTVRQRDQRTRAFQTIAMLMRESSVKIEGGFGICLGEKFRTNSYLKSEDDESEDEKKEVQSSAPLAEGCHCVSVETMGKVSRRKDVQSRQFRIEKTH